MKMEAEHIILTRLLPKTGQETSYVAGDDGHYQAGWWRGKLLVDNKTRYVVKTIGGDVVVIDNATGLMWAADGDAAGCYGGLSNEWDIAITIANGLDFAGFTDWRLPNTKELFSIMDYGVGYPCITEPPFSNTFKGSYWTSTTDVGVSSYAYSINFGTSLVAKNPKDADLRIRCVRSGL